MNPTNATASYNVAVSLVRLGLLLDAAKWYEETLKRDPQHPEAAEIRRRIQRLRK